MLFFQMTTTAREIGQYKSVRTSLKLYHMKKAQIITYRWVVCVAVNFHIVQPYQVDQNPSSMMVPKTIFVCSAI